MNKLINSIIASVFIFTCPGGNEQRTFNWPTFCRKCYSKVHLSQSTNTLHWEQLNFKSAGQCVERKFQLIQLFGRHGQSRVVTGKSDRSKTLLSPEAFLIIIKLLVRNIHLLPLFVPLHLHHLCLYCSISCIRWRIWGKVGCRQIL